MAEQNRPPLSELLANVDRDIAHMPAPVPREERVENVASLTGDVLRRAADDTAKTVMRSVEETEAKIKALREKAEHAMTQLGKWTDDFAEQNRQLIEHCTALEASINETVQHIVKIGAKPINGRGEVK